MLLPFAWELVVAELLVGDNKTKYTKRINQSTNLTSAIGFHEEVLPCWCLQLQQNTTIIHTIHVNKNTNSLEGNWSTWITMFPDLGICKTNFKEQCIKSAVNKQKITHMNDLVERSYSKNAVGVSRMTFLKSVLLSMNVVFVINNYLTLQRKFLWKHTRSFLWGQLILRVSIISNL